MFGDCLGHTGCFLSQAHVAFCRPLALSPLVPAVPPLGLGLAALSQRWFVLACCLAVYLYLFGGWLGSHAHPAPLG